MPALGLLKGFAARPRGIQALASIAEKMRPALMQQSHHFNHTHARLTSPWVP